ncbi:MAG: transcriptional repressor LexA [Desulfomonile tiedjei]|nr:transcriptional repressor LexA [Desulfomonile tiedjei]
MRSLTKKQKLVFDYIRRFMEEYGHAPSYEEIARGLGLSSPSNIHVHVENLKTKGFLTKKWNANRSIDLAEPRPTTHVIEEVPLSGRIAAGSPIEALEDTETMAIPAAMMGRGSTFVLQVKGDSMVEDHIMDGDYVIVEKRDAAVNGEMVVALIRNSEATLKRYRRRGSRIMLEPANPSYQPMVLDEKDVTIQGVVVGILRKYRK